jgi:MoxR-like ATPase
MAKKPRSATPQTQFVEHTIPGTDIKMSKRAERHPLAPEKRPFIFPSDQVKDVAVAMKLGMNVMLTGPTGCGKTALPRALCAELGEPLIRFNCDGETRVSNLRGMNVPAAEDGVLTLRFSPGDLAICMREGYKVLLDEIDAALPSVRFVLQPVLEEDNRTLHVPETGETIVAAKGFGVFATGNTVGYRASSRAQHAGTTSMNAAFLDRFGMVIACDYPNRAEEFKRIRVNVPECEEDIIEAICRVAEELRSDEKFKSDFSTRRCIQWARLMVEYDFENILHVSELALVRKLEFATDARVAREVIQRILGFAEQAT